MHTLMSLRPDLFERGFTVIIVAALNRAGLSITLTFFDRFLCTTLTRCGLFS